MSDISLRLSLLSLSDSAAQVKSERVEDGLQLNRNITDPVLAAVARKCPAFIPYGPNGEILTVHDQLNNGEGILMTLPPYQDSYGPYREFEIDWFKLVLWATEVSGQLEWFYQFTLIDDPATSCFDRTKEDIKIYFCADRQWYELESGDIPLAPTSSQMQLIYPEKRGFPERTKHIGIVFPPPPYFHQM